MQKKTKVLELLPSLNYGGAQTMIINLCRYFDYDKVQCDFIIDHGDMLDLKELVESFGADVYTMPSFKGTNLKQIKEAWDAFFSEHDYDIIHCHIRSYASMIIGIARKHGIKTIIHSHNTSNGKGIGGFIKTMLQLPMRKMGDYYFACSREAGEWMFGKKICQQDNFHIINNAIDTDVFTYDEKIRERYRRMFDLHGERVFIQVGRMNRQKNYLFTLDLFKEYMTDNRDSRLFIVGDGELEDEIRNRIALLKIQDHVTILQHRDDVADLLQMADVFLMPSLYEGLSVACVEAQSTGIICLCSDKVDHNVDKTGNCRFIELDIGKWIEAMNADISGRRSYKKEITEAGFDARANAKWLQDFYQKAA
jgi:glycosyltransferase involved in cell wall biosynthesis